MREREKKIKSLSTLSLLTWPLVSSFNKICDFNCLFVFFFLMFCSCVFMFQTDKLTCWIKRGFTWSSKYMLSSYSVQFDRKHDYLF